jgi:hypothetical protein
VTMPHGPARVLLVATAAALLVAAAVGVNVVLLGYVNREPGPAGRLSPRTTVTTTPTTPPRTTTAGDDDTHGPEPDD